MRTTSYQSLRPLPCAPNSPMFPQIATPTHPFGHPSPSHLAQPLPLLLLIFHFMPVPHQQSPLNPTSSVSSNIVQPPTRSLSPSSFISIAWPSSRKSRQETNSSLTAVTSTVSSSQV